MRITFILIIFLIGCKSTNVNRYFKANIQQDTRKPNYCFVSVFKEIYTPISIHDSVIVVPVSEDWKVSDMFSVNSVVKKTIKKPDFLMEPSNEKNAELDKNSSDIIRFENLESTLQVSKYGEEPKIINDVCLVTIKEPTESIVDVKYYDRRTYGKNVGFRSYTGQTYVRGRTRYYEVPVVMDTIANRGFKYVKFHFNQKPTFGFWGESRAMCDLNISTLFKNDLCKSLKNIGYVQNCKSVDFLEDLKKPLIKFQKEHGVDTTFIGLETLELLELENYLN